jgi:hypothetical protein
MENDNDPTSGIGVMVWIIGAGLVFWLSVVLILVAIWLLVLFH